MHPALENFPVIMEVSIKGHAPTLLLDYKNVSLSSVHYINHHWPFFSNALTTYSLIRNYVVEKPSFCQLLFLNLKTKKFPKKSYFIFIQDLVNRCPRTSFLVILKLISKNALDVNVYVHIIS